MTDAIEFASEPPPLPARPASSPVLSTRTFIYSEDGEEAEGDGDDLSDVEKEEVVELVHLQHLEVNNNHQKVQQQQHQNHHPSHPSRRRRSRRGSDSKSRDRSLVPTTTTTTTSDSSHSMTSLATTTTFTSTATTSSSNHVSQSHHAHHHNHHHHNHTSQPQTPSATSTVSTASSKSLALPPLTASDSLQHNLKNQFLLGSTTFFDSFFGQDELDRFFPDHKLRLAVVTWNMSSKAPAASLNGGNGSGHLEASYQRTLRSILMPKQPTTTGSDHHHRHHHHQGSRNNDNTANTSRLPELFVIGLQETPKSEVVVGQLKVALQAALGPNYVLLQWSAVGVLHASVWLRRELLWSCTAVDTVPIHSRPTAANRIRTKGAVALSFSLFGTAFLFINTHLSAHETNLRTRINQLDKVQQILNLKQPAASSNKNSNATFSSYIAKNETNSAASEVAGKQGKDGEVVQNGEDDEQKPQVPSGSSNKAAPKAGQNHHSEYVFWFGDLNFRLELPQESVQAAIKQIATAPNSEERLLHQHRLMRSDQLTNLMTRGMIFDGFREAIWPPPFLPTYKCKMKSSKTAKISSHSLPRLKTRRHPKEKTVVQTNTTQEAVTLTQSESQSNSSSSPSSQSVDSSASSIITNQARVDSPASTITKQQTNYSSSLTPPPLAIPITAKRSSSRSVPLNLNSLTDEEEEEEDDEDEEDEGVITASFNTSRVPSFTDRILYQARLATEDQFGSGLTDLTDRGAIRCLAYSAIRSVDSSDHKPVRALFEVDLDAGGPRVPLRLKKQPAYSHSPWADRAENRPDEVKARIRAVLESGETAPLSSSSSEQVLTTLGLQPTSSSTTQLESQTKADRQNLSSFFGRRLGRKGRQKRKESKLLQQQQLHSSVSMSSLPSAVAALGASLDSKLTRLNAGAFERQVFIDGLRLRNSLVSSVTSAIVGGGETSTLPAERRSKLKFGFGGGGVGGGGINNNTSNINRTNQHKRSLYKSRSFDSNVDSAQQTVISSTSTSVIISPPPSEVDHSASRRQRPQSEGPVVTTPTKAATSSSAAVLSTVNLEAVSKNGITKESSSSVATNNSANQSNGEATTSKSSSICSIA